MNQSTRSEQLKAILDQVGSTHQSKSIRSTLESRASSKSSGPVLDVRRTNTEALESQYALESLDVIQRGGKIDSEQQFVLEAIVMPLYRPVVDIVDDYIVTDQLNNWQELGNESRREWTRERILAVGRINVPGIQYAGTGFIVGPGLIMTNRHVAAFFAQGLGQRVGFQSGQHASIDFYHEKGTKTTESLKVEKVLLIHPWWDMALLKVSGLPRHRKPLTLSTADPTTLKGRNVVVIGYPGFDPTGDDEFQRVQNRIFRGTYSVKRFQPGLFQVREDAPSYDRNISAVTHDCSTLGGNSGSAVIDVETGDVVGLHFAGAYLIANYAISPFDLAQDPFLASVGVNFSGRVDPRGDFYGPIKAAWDSVATDVERAATPNAGNSIQPTTTPAESQSSQTTQIMVTPAANTATWTIPLQISVTIGTPVLATEVGSQPIAPLRIPATAPTTEAWFTRSPPAATTAPFHLSALDPTFFNWKSALSLALASKLAYEGKSDVERTTKSVWGFETCEFIDVDDTQCFVAMTQTIALVAFRGTESRGDWFTNINVPARTRSYGGVHRGFLGAFQAVESRINEALSQLNGRTLFLTGHSLGGAIATVMAAEWQATMSAKWISTYGQPAVGSGMFRSFFLMNYAGRFCRFVNDDDIVPRVPPGYVHVGRLLHFDARGELQGGPGLPSSKAATAESIAIEAVNQGPPMLTEEQYRQLQVQLAEPLTRGVESLTGPTQEGLLPSVGDHSMDRYIAKIASKVAVDNDSVDS